MSRRDSLLALLVMVIWGVNFLAIEWGLQDVPPLLFAAIRFVAVVLPAVFLVARPAVPWRTLAGIGLFMSAGQFGFVYAAMEAGLPPGIAALVLQAQVVFTIVIAAGVLRELPTPVQVLGVAVATVGLVVVGAGRGGEVPLTALVLCLCGALSWGVGNTIARAAKAPGGLGVTVWSALFVPLPLFAVSLLVEGPSAIGDGLAAFGWKAAASTAFTAGVSSLLGYGIFNSLLARNPAHQVVPWVLVVPPVAMVSAWIAFGDQPNAAEVMGGLVMLLGVLIALRPPARVRTVVPVEAPA
ncbi:EamA family transporter [Nocardioides jejuensis]|uniref:EamA family transporter n=1 Tax=Nocardioides jejuensis TaxID=2502782 RepID=A0A4R1CM08_9ACTN|nr:EamA family transporter [Nocardioides jejuensis]TCJ31088.1 EamA family transporter [Nocardioides jejuensis]